MSVTPIKLSAKRAQQLIRSAAKDSSRVINTLSFRDDEVWFEITSSRQIQLCLEEGQILGPPTLNEHGHWVCRVHRLCGGQDVVAVVAIANGDDATYRLYIIGLENRL